MNALNYLFGLGNSERLGQANIAFHGLSLKTGLFIGLVLILITLGTVWRFTPQLKLWQNSCLVGLRFTWFILILFLLMKPVLQVTINGSIRQELLVLIDSSSSMEFKDLRADHEDIVRAAIAQGIADPKGGLNQPVSIDNSPSGNPARSEVVKAMLSNSKLQLLDKLSRTYNLVPFTFGKTLEAVSLDKSAASDTTVLGTAQKDPATFLESITFDKPATAIGDAIDSVLELKRGDPVAGIFLVTDGGNNAGAPPLYAAALAGQQKVPLYIYGVGISSPHDIAVTQISAPEVMFIHEQAQVSVQVHSQSMVGRSATLVLKAGDQVVDSKPVLFQADGDQSIAMSYTPGTKGDYELEASIVPLPEEANKDNNKAFQRVRVIESKIAVLYIERTPRWEFRYLQGMLLRDARFDSKFVLLEGDSSLSHEANSPYLQSIPTSKDEWAAYDVVIIGDVDSDAFSADQQQNISDWVSNYGGGIVFLSGKRFMPETYKGSALENIIPVEFDSDFSSGFEMAGPAIHLDLTPFGRTSASLRLADDEADSAGIWQNLSPVYWDARVTGAKPGAQVLLSDPSPAKSGHEGAMPVVAIQNYGSGEALFMGTDQTWRWRRNVGEKYYTRLWGQILLRLGLPRLIGPSRTMQMITEKKDYVTGDIIKVSGRLFQRGTEPMLDPKIIGTLSIHPDKPDSKGDLTQQVTIRSAPGRPGYYEGEFMATMPGVYTLKVGDDSHSTLNIRVMEAQLETSQSALNTALLQKMAEASGGAFYREEDLYKLVEPADERAQASPENNPVGLPNGLRARSETVPTIREIDLAYNPYYYALMIAILTAEWTLRKRLQLV